MVNNYSVAIFRQGHEGNIIKEQLQHEVVYSANSPEEALGMVLMQPPTCKQYPVKYHSVIRLDPQEEKNGQ